MNEREMLRVFEAGKSISERELTQSVRVLVCMIADACLLYKMFSATITEMIIVNIIVTFGSAMVIDGGWNMLSILVWKQDVDIKIKTVCHVLIIAISGFVFIQLGRFRMETVGNLVGNSLGLVSNNTVPGLKTLGMYIALLPVATSIYIYVSGLITHNPGKKANDLQFFLARSYNRTTKLMKARAMYGSDEERRTEMYEYVEAQTDAARNEVKNSEEINNLLFDRMLAEHLEADPEQISMIMEREELI